MGASTRVLFLTSTADKKYRKYLAILKSCEEGKVTPPKEVLEYFGGDIQEISEEYPLCVEVTARAWCDGDACEGYEIDVVDIPDGVETIRVMTCY